MPIFSILIYFNLNFAINSRNRNKSMENTSEKLKILCLHGYRQNAESFKSKLGSFRKLVSKYAEFTFVTAPHQAPPLNKNEPVDSSQKSWWFNKEDGTFKGTNQDGPAFGFEESLKFLEKIWKDEGPFQGLLGFSQGACFVGLLCGLRLKSFTSIDPKFVILSSGFQSGSLVHKNIYEETFDIPSLHIFGENDDIIPKDMSELLVSSFENPKILRHSGGHYFPATAQQKQFYVEYFEEQIANHIKNKNTEGSEISNLI